MAATAFRSALLSKLAFLCAASSSTERGHHEPAFLTPPPAGGQIIPFNAEQSLVFAEAENFTAAAGKLTHKLST